jgi:RNA polymerase sigma factor for flagellar operon FliA
MLDELRHADWLPRSVRKNMRQIEAAMSRLEQRFGRPPTESELAAELGVSLADYQQMLQDARGHQLLYYEDFQDTEDADFFERHHVTDAENPLRILENQDFRRELIEAIKLLPERERQVMAMYYEQELNLREIGAVLGVSESRVCQIHTQAVARLRVRLREWLEGEH